MASVDFRGLRTKKVGPKRSRWGGRCDGGVGFGAIGAGGFLPVKDAGGCKTLAGAYFHGRGACTQYDPKVVLGAKTPDPKGDAYCGSKES